MASASCVLLVMAMSCSALVDALTVGLAPKRWSARRSSVALAELQSNFYAVYHTVKPGTANEFWDGIAQADGTAMCKAQHKMDIFNHNFLPAAANGPILCVWECKDLSVDSQQFEAFIDAPEWHSGNLSNKIYPINPIGIVPPSAWPRMPSKPAASSGSFFWVHHTFRKGKAHDFWADMAEMDMDAFEATCRAQGVVNHYFLPTTDPDTVFCVWESEKPMDATEFQAWMDGPNGVSPGMFDNVVYPVVEGATLPSAKFPRSWLDDTMAKVEKLLPLNVETLVARLEKATVLLEHQALLPY